VEGRTVFHTREHSIASPALLRSKYFVVLGWRVRWFLGSWGGLMVQQERAARTREALIGAAAEVFGRVGFTVASLTAISSRAGVSNGALHFHFASKTDLAGAVEEAALGRLGALMVSGGGGVGGCLQGLVDASHGLVRELGCDVVLRAGFELCGDSARRVEWDVRLYWQRWIEETLLLAKGRGELDGSVDVGGVVTAVVAATVGFEVLGVRDPVWLSRRTMTRFWELLLPRLAARGVRTVLVPGGISAA
jgi:AcrR family transcriptional regulator